MREADVNVLLQTITEGVDVISGKMFEYLGVQRPILAVVDLTGGDAWLMNETGAGTVVPHADTAAVASAMRSYYELWRQVSLSDTHSTANLQQYERRRLTGELAKTLDRIVAHNVT